MFAVAENKFSYTVI